VYDQLALLCWLRICQMFRLMRGYSNVYRHREKIIRACIAQQQMVRAPRPDEPPT